MTTLISILGLLLALIFIYLFIHHSTMAHTIGDTIMMRKCMSGIKRRVEFETYN